MMRQLIVVLSAVCFALPLCARPQSGFYTNPELDELRIELDDLRHGLKTTQVELSLLDERLKKGDSALIRGKETSGLALLSAQVNAMEKKITGLEKTIEKAAHDLHTLSGASNLALTKIQIVEQSLASHEKRLDEVVKLKGTLTTISKAISQRPSTDSTKSYLVKAGDSLEKIARINHVSVESIRKVNPALSKDKIIIGQELRLPDDGT
jgi:LysM repeat protein